MKAIGDLLNNKKSDTMNLYSDLSNENKKRINFSLIMICMIFQIRKAFCHRRKNTPIQVFMGECSRSARIHNYNWFSITWQRKIYSPCRTRGLTPEKVLEYKVSLTFWRQTPLCRVSKNSITRLIGDAVPPNLGEAAMLIGLASCRKFH